jgi:hypothetical protein
MASLRWRSYLPRSDRMTVTKATDQLSTQRLRVRGWRFLVMAMMTLVVAFTICVTLPLRPTAPSNGSLALEIVAENDHKLPTDRPDYGLMEHGTHCLGHAVIRTAAGIAEPFRAHNAAHQLSNQFAIASANLSRPEKPPRV